MGEWVPEARDGLGLKPMKRGTWEMPRPTAGNNTGQDIVPMWIVRHVCTLEGCTANVWGKAKCHSFISEDHARCYAAWHFWRCQCHTDHLYITRDTACEWAEQIRVDRVEVSLRGASAVFSAEGLRRRYSAGWARARIE